MKQLGKVTKWLKSKRHSRVLGISGFMLIFAVIGTVLLFRSFAAGERLYIAPATSTVQTGNDVTVTLRMDTGTIGANAVDATITYDQTKLQFKSIDTTASAFTADFIATGGNGTVNIVRGLFNNSLSGDVEVAKITFTAISSTATTATLTLSGEAANGETPIVPSFTNGTVNITVPSAPSRSAAFTIESTVAAPVVGTPFGLQVYVTATNAMMQGGEVTVNLPAGLSYQQPLNTTGTAFNPVTTVTDTGPQKVNLVFVTQSTTLTGKQLVATIPVTATTTGAKSVSFTGARLADLNELDITPVTANPFSINVTSASLPAPTVSRQGGTALTASNNITDMRQAFTITNFDSAATYTVTLGGTAITASGNTFSIPTSIRNGDLTLQVGVTRTGASGSSSFTIRLRSPNVNRVGCVELLDLLSVNGGYGAASTEFDLNFDGTVGLVDLLTVTQGWGGSCV